MTIEQRLDQLEQQNQRIECKNKRLMAALTALLIGVVFTFSVGASLEDDPIRVPKEDFLRLMISDKLRENFGLWLDPIHWRKFRPIGALKRAKSLSRHEVEVRL